MNKLHLFPAKDVAMELSLVDSGLLRRIKPEELKDAAWTKKATKVGVGMVSVRGGVRINGG